MYVLQKNKNLKRKEPPYWLFWTSYELLQHPYIDYRNSVTKPIEIIEKSNFNNVLNITGKLEMD